jgi:hypothetical protein
MNTVTKCSIVSLLACTPLVAHGQCGECRNPVTSNLADTNGAYLYIYGLLKLSGGSYTRSDFTHVFDYDLASSGVVDGFVNTGMDCEDLLLNYTGSYNDSDPGSTPVASISEYHDVVPTLSSNTFTNTHSVTGVASDVSGNLLYFTDSLQGWSAAYQIARTGNPMRHDYSDVLYADVSDDVSFTVTTSSSSVNLEFTLDSLAGTTRVRDDGAYCTSPAPEVTWGGARAKVRYDVFVDNVLLGTIHAGAWAGDGRILRSTNFAPRTVTDSGTGVVTNTASAEWPSGAPVALSTVLAANTEYEIRVLRNRESGSQVNNCFLADFNNDGVFDTFDYLDFVAAFSIESPDADINSDGVVDFFDYLEFLAIFDECDGV